MDGEHATSRLGRALKNVGRELVRHLRIVSGAILHPRVPWYAKLVCVCSVMYVVSPVQLIPNFIPVLGQMDDVFVLGVSVKLLTRSVPRDVIQECEATAWRRGRSGRGGPLQHVGGEAGV